MSDIVLALHIIVQVAIVGIASLGFVFYMNIRGKQYEKYVDDFTCTALAVMGLSIIIHGCIILCSM